MKSLRITAALGLFLSTAGFASAQEPAFSKSPEAVQAGAYNIEPVHTRVLFSVSHMGFTTWYGNFDSVSGSLTLDPKHPADAKLDVTLPIASVSSPSAKLDGELKEADWLDATKFPTAHFVSHKVTPGAPGHADISGDLTLHGVTKPVVLHATFNGSGVNPLDKAYTVGFEATGKIKRSEFGVGKYVPLIGDEVTLIISAAFEQKK